MPTPQITIARKLGSQNLMDRVHQVTKLAAYVGIPADNASRQDVLLTMAGKVKGKRKKAYLQHAATNDVNNAELLFIFSKGSPIRKQPPRTGRVDTSYSCAEQPAHAKDAKESKYIDGPNNDGEYSAGAFIDGDTAQRAGFKTYSDAADWVRVMLQKMRRQKATDSSSKRERLHRALDHVLDARDSGRAKDTASKYEWKCPKCSQVFTGENSDALEDRAWYHLERVHQDNSVLVKIHRNVTSL